MFPNAPPAERTRPFLLLPATIFSLTCAGVIYWWPAVNPGLQRALNFSDNQADILVAVAGSGSTVGILGGFFHDYYGTRATALAAALGLSLNLTAFAVLVLTRPLFLGALLFPLCVLLVIAFVTFSFMLYSSCITAAAAVFSPRYRGRVVGLCSAAFGGSAAVLTAVQTALFPSLTDTAPLLFFTAVLCLLPAALAAYIFPSAERFDEDTTCVSGEDAPLLDEPHAVDAYVDKRLSTAYKIAFVYVALLQAAALVDIVGSSRIVRLVVAALVVTGLASFMLLHKWSSLTVSAAVTQTPLAEQSADLNMANGGADGPDDAAQTDEREQQQQPEPPFSAVLLDPRYLYECLNSLVLIGGGGIALLVQAPHIVKAHGLARDATSVSEWVRTLVALFAACSVLARFIVGAVMDRGTSATSRVIWKFQLMHTNVLAMATGFILLAVGSRGAVLAGAALVGLSHGLFFSVAAALTTVWFGVRNFPRNFACIGPFIAAGSAVLASGIPMWVRGKFGHWSGVGTERVCDSAQCVRPALLFLATLQVLTFIVGVSVWPPVRKGARGIL